MMTLATGWYITLVTGLKVYTDRTASPKIKIDKIDKKYKTDFYFLSYDCNFKIWTTGASGIIVQNSLQGISIWKKNYLPFKKFLQLWKFLHLQSH
jgi:hypothetical protein